MGKDAFLQAGIAALAFTAVAGVGPNAKASCITDRDHPTCVDVPRPVPRYNPPAISTYRSTPNTSSNFGAADAVGAAGAAIGAIGPAVRLGGAAIDAVAGILGPLTDIPNTIGPAQRQNDASENETRAWAQFALGKTAFEAGKCHEAAAHFQNAYLISYAYDNTYAAWRDRAQHCAQQPVATPAPPPAASTWGQPPSAGEAAIAALGLEPVDSSPLPYAASSAISEETTTADELNRRQLQPVGQPAETAPVPSTPGASTPPLPQAVSLPPDGGQPTAIDPARLSSLVTYLQSASPEVRQGILDKLPPYLRDAANRRLQSPAGQTVPGAAAAPKGPLRPSTAAELNAQQRQQLQQTPGDDTSYDPGGRSANCGRLPGFTFSCGAAPASR